MTLDYKDFSRKVAIVGVGESDIGFVPNRNVMELAVRAYGGDELSPWFVDRLDRALLTHAKLVGNLGERVVLMPADQVAAFLKEMKEESSKEAVDLIDAMPRLVKPQKALGTGGKA